MTFSMKSPNSNPRRTNWIYEGACQSLRPRRILVSPRSEVKSRRLREEHPDIIEIARYFQLFFTTIR